MEIERIVSFLGLLFLTVVMTLLGCSQTTSTAEIDPMRTNIDNDICFVYDVQSGLTQNDFSGLDTLTSLKIRFGNPLIHKNEETYYTVYSLSGDRLCYVFLLFSPDTGVDCYVNDIQMVSKGDSEKTFYDLLLEKDLPKNVFPSS